MSEPRAHKFQACTTFPHRHLASHVGTPISTLRRPHPTMCIEGAHTYTPYLVPRSFQNSAELSDVRLTVRLANDSHESHAPFPACGAHLRNSCNWQGVGSACAFPHTFLTMLLHCKASNMLDLRRQEIFANLSTTTMHCSILAWRYHQKTTVHTSKLAVQHEGTFVGNIGVNQPAEWQRRRRQRRMLTQQHRAYHL